MNYLFYDFLQVSGGAERVSLVLAGSFDRAKLVVSRRYPAAEPLLDGYPARILSLGSRWSRLLGRIPEALFCFKLKCRFLAGADNVIYSGFYAPMAVHQQKQGRKIYYCHTIPRFAFDLYEHYRHKLPVGSRWLFALLMAWIRREYRRALAEMDTIITNSENIRQRLHTHLGLDAEVIHPPVDTDSFSWRADGDYYLSTARLEAYKRVDLVIKAFMGMPEKRLVVASSGAEEQSLRKLAQGSDNIHFTGRQTEEELRRWVGEARATIYVPIDEDFGLSPVEAMAAGKPVIGVASGGLLETVVDGVTGILIEESLDENKLKQAVEQLEELGPEKLRDACEQRAQAFSERRFLQRMHEVCRQPPSAGTIASEEPDSR